MYKTTLLLLFIGSHVFCMDKQENSHNDIGQVVSTLAMQYTQQECSESKGMWSVSNYNKVHQKSLDQLKYFTHSSLFDNENNQTLTSKSGVLSSDALEDMDKNLTLIDCGCFTSFLYYKALLTIVGKENFDNNIQQIRLSILGCVDKKSSLSKYANFTRAAKNFEKGSLGNRSIALGEECHFKGITWYANKHPVGFGGGYNVIYVGKNNDQEQLFVGLGFKKPLTEREIYLKMLDDYNEERTLEDLRYIAQAMSYDLVTDQNKSAPYKNNNVYLLNYWTIDQKDFEKDRKKFGCSFLAGSQRGLNQSKIAAFKNICINNFYKECKKEIIAKIVVD